MKKHNSKVKNHSILWKVWNAKLFCFWSEMSQLQSLRKYSVLSHTLNTKRKFKKIKSSKQKIQSTILKQKVNKSYKIWKLLKTECCLYKSVSCGQKIPLLWLAGWSVWSVLRQSWFQFSISIWFHRSWCSISKSKELMFFCENFIAFFNISKWKEIMFFENSRVYNACPGPGRLLGSCCCSRESQDWRHRDISSCGRGWSSSL